MKVVWRGGRQFSSQENPAQKVDNSKPKTNGADDAIMIIDSDEESAPEPPKEETPSYHFELEETEVDPAYPFEDVLREIDIPFGSRVLELAVPHVLPETARSALESFPPILTKMIVVSAVCADYSTRVVSLPLSPPHPSQTDPSTWKVQTIVIGSGTSHQEIPRGVSITFTCQEGDLKQELDRSRRRSTSKRPGTDDTENWNLLLATHSAEGSGLLLLHHIPILKESKGVETFYHLSEGGDIETKRRHLPIPAQSIAFNPSPCPSARHSTLLVAFHSGCVKIYSCFSPKPHKTQRRSSSEQSDFEAADTDGKWLITLYPGFEQSPSGLGRRKTVIDTKWVLGGRAVMALLADGEWGVWDIEGAGPGSTKGPLERQSSIQGVSGGSLTTYSVSGKILSPFPAKGSDMDGVGIEQRPKLAPTTPSTKRIREDTLLKGSFGSSSTSLSGQISVFQINSSRDALPDESILVRHGNQSAVIPSLLSLWRNAIKATGTFDSSNRCRASPIQDINFMGEAFKGIGHLPAASRRSRETGRTEFDIIITTEHRIIILAPKLTERVEKFNPQGPVSGKSAAEKDQLMLRRGELDVEGMDRVLSGMTSKNQSLRMASPVKRTRIFS